MHQLSQSRACTNLVDNDETEGVTGMHQPPHALPRVQALIVALHALNQQITKS
jgi:hypothetical protein